MRTTITLDDDSFAKAQEFARSRRISLGKAVSSLVRRGVARPFGTKEINGLSVFDLPPDLCSELEKINLLQISKKPARNVLIIRSCQSGDEGALEGHLNQSEASTTGDLLDIPKVWLPTVDGSLLVPNKALQSVVSWVSRIHA